MILTLVDPSALGRLDYFSMSQQALMECLVAQLDASSLKSFRDRKKHFKDVHAWHGVECNSEGDVIGIDWMNSGRMVVSGTIDYQWLPPTVSFLRIQIESDAPPLVGPLNFNALPQSLQNLYLYGICSRYPSSVFEIRGSFSDLPHAMKKLNIAWCGIKMPLCLTGIPKMLSEIDILEHDFGDMEFRSDSTSLAKVMITRGTKEGTLSFIDSPRSLVFLGLELNKRVGSLSFEGLGPRLETLGLNFNALCGTVVFENIPSSLQTLCLERAKFERMVFDTPLPVSLKRFFVSECGLGGTFSFRHFSKAVEIVMLSENQLSGSVQIAHLESVYFLDASKNLLSGSLDLRNLPSKLVELNLCANKLTGTVDFSALPNVVQGLHLNNNGLTGSFVIESFPKSLQRLSLAMNKFEMKVLVVPIGAKNLPVIDLRMNGVEKVTNAKGRKITAKTVLL